MEITGKGAQKNVEGIMKKIRKGYKTWLLIDRENNLKKKNIRRRNTKKLENISEEDREI